MRYDLIVVGAGPAGLAAAGAALERGLSVALVDERKGLGGSLRGELGASAAESDGCWLIPVLPGGEAWQAQVDGLCRGAAGAALFLDSLAWGLFPGWLLAVTHGGRTQRVEADQIVLATGGYVTLPPFPGHALGGVVTPLGLVQAQAAGQFRPGARVAVLGTGPLCDAVVAWVSQQGGRVVGIIDEAPMPAPLPVTVMTAPLRAHGEGRLEGVTVPAEGGEVQMPTDWLCVTGPVSAAVELANMAGVPMRFAGYQQGFMPLRGRDMSTEAAGLFVAGALAGAGDVASAAATGRVAGLAAAVRAGKASAADLESAVAAVPARPVRQGPDQVPLLFRSLAPDANLPACHCTGHSLQEVAEAIADGSRSIDDVKRQVKVGMGVCQGRDCHRTVVRLLAQLGGVDTATLAPMRGRAPIRPVAAAAMYEGEVKA